MRVSEKKTMARAERKNGKIGGCKEEGKYQNNGMGEAVGRDRG